MACREVGSACGMPSAIGPACRYRREIASARGDCDLGVPIRAVYRSSVFDNTRSITYCDPPTLASTAVGPLSDDEFRRLSDANTAGSSLEIDNLTSNASDGGGGKRYGLSLSYGCIPAKVSS